MKAPAFLLLVAVCFCTIPDVHAKTPTEVFEAVSNSVVVVYGNDSAGKHKSLGSGVVVAKGEVVTNCHVVNGAAGLQVKYRGREYAAFAKHSDEDRDVCSLTVEGLAAPPANLAATTNLKVGQRVYAIGAPSGLELTLSEGIISSFRELEGGRYIQTTAPISAGSSGGGLFDEDARLVGLPTFFLAKGQQLNFAVPVEWIKDLPQRQAHRKSQESRPDWQMLSLQFWLRKDWRALLQHARKWTRAHPKDPLAWVDLGQAYQRLKDPTKAIDSYVEGLRHIPENELLMSALASAYKNSGQPQKAINTYIRMLRTNPNRVVVWMELGITYQRTGQTEKAVAAFREMVRIDSEDEAAWSVLGDGLAEAGQPAEAIQAFERSIKIDPNNAEVWTGLGFAYASLGQWLKAVETFQQALRIEPNYFRAWHGLGTVYTQIDRSEEAIESLTHAVRLDPQSAVAWYHLGMAYENDGQRDRVMEIYRRLKTMDAKLAEQFFNKVVLP